MDKNMAQKFRIDFDVLQYKLEIIVFSKTLCILFLIYIDAYCLCLQTGLLFVWFLFSFYITTALSFNPILYHISFLKWHLVSTVPLSLSFLVNNKKASQSGERSKWGLSEEENVVLECVSTIKVLLPCRPGFLPNVLENCVFHFEGTSNCKRFSCLKLMKSICFYSELKKGTFKCGM